MQTTKWVSVTTRAQERDIVPSTEWRHIAAGLEPPAVKLSAGMSRLARHEIDAIDSARLAGAGDDEIRKLVRQLVADRKQPVAA